MRHPAWRNLKEKAIATAVICVVYLDNRVKVLLDALQGIAYADDSQVSEIHAYQGDDCRNPRVEVCITGIDDLPKSR